MGRPRSDLRKRIVEAARARFLEEGVAGSSLREIAADAKTSLGMIVYYFPKKDDLFLASIEEIYAAFTADVGAILAGDGALRDRLGKVLARIGAASAKELEVVRLVAREALGSSVRRRRILRRFMEGHLPLAAKAFAAGVREGELDVGLPVPVMLVAFIGVGAIPQFARKAARGAPPDLALPDAAALAEISLELLFRAIGPRGPKLSSSGASAARPASRSGRGPRA